MYSQIEELLKGKKYNQVCTLLKTRAETSAVFYDTEEFNFIYEFFLRISDEYGNNRELFIIINTLIDMLKTGLDKTLCFRNKLIINDDRMIIAIMKLTTYEDTCFIAMSIS